MNERIRFSPRKEKHLCVFATILLMTGFIVFITGLAFDESNFLFGIASGLIVFSFFFVFASFRKDMKLIAEWKKEVVNTFKVERKHVIYISDKAGNNESISKNENHVNEDGKEKKFLKVSFIDKSSKYTVRQWFEIFEMEDEEKPYVEYRYVPYYFNSHLKEGYYETKLFVPKDWMWEEGRSWSDFDFFEKQRSKE